MKHCNIKKFSGLLLIALLYCISVACTNWTVPESLIGTWKGKDLVTVRIKENGEFKFIKAPDSLEFKIEIHKDGSVTGNLGKAVFSKCKVNKNRGELGKKLNLATDFVIKGELEGKIFENDPEPSKKISMPFDNKNNNLKGSLFQMYGFDLYPIADVNLFKQN